MISGDPPATRPLHSANWIVHFYDWTPSVWGNAFLCATLVFLSTLAISLLLGLGTLYITSPVTYFGALAVAWVAAWVRWGLDRLPAHIDLASSCFLATDRPRFCDYWKSRFVNNRGAVTWALVWWILGALAVYRGLAFQQVPDTLARNTWMIPAGWFQDDNFAKAFVFWWFGIGPALVTGAATELFITNASFLRSMRQLQPIPLAGPLLTKFRCLSSFYGTVCVVWFVGIGITALVAFNYLSVEATTFLAITTGIGVLTVVYPHIVFRNLLNDVQAATAERVIEALREYDVPVFANGSLNVNALRTCPDRIAALVALAQPTGVWVYSVREILFFIVGTFWSPVGLFLKPHISRLLLN